MSLISYRKYMALVQMLDSQRFLFDYDDGHNQSPSFMTKDRRRANEQNYPMKAKHKNLD